MNDSTGDGSDLSRAIAAGLAAVAVAASVLVVFDRAFGPTHLSQDVSGMVYVLPVFLAAALGVFVVGRRSRVLNAWLFPDDRLESGETGDDGPDTESLRHFARWFVRMRWVASAIAVTMSVAATRVLEVLDRDLLAPLMVTVGVLVAANVLYSLAISHTRRPRLLIMVQVYVDLVVLVTLLHFSGGIENPVHVFVIFHVIISGILLRPAQCYAVAAVAAALIAVMVFAEWSGLLSHTTLLLFPHNAGHDHHAVSAVEHAAHYSPYVIAQTSLLTVILFLTAFFITSVVGRLRAEQARVHRLVGQAREEKQRLEKVVDAAGAGLLVAGAGGTTVWINDTLTRWLGALSGRKEPAHVAREWVAGEEDPISRSLAEGTVQTVRRSLPTDGGSLQHFQVSASPMVAGPDATPQSVVLIEDITELVAKQEQLVQSAKLASVGELAGHVAHEINNPTAVISTKARLLLSDDGLNIPEAVRQDLGTFVDLSDRITRIAQALLTYSRPSTGERSRTNVATALLRALRFARMARGRSEVQVTTSLSPDVPEIQANPAELEQVFVNLISNAMDAMPTGGTLSLDAARRSKDCDGDWVVVGIEDSGPGISEDIQLRMFEPFVTTKQSGDGTGLGLAICAGIVRSHGGRIEVSCEAGRGTRFDVWLPAGTGKEGRS